MKYSLLACLLIGLCVLSMPAWAQAPPEPGSTAATTPAKHVDPATTRRRYNETLADVLPNVIWDPQVRGPLLVVSADETKVHTDIVYQDVGMSSGTPAPPLEPDSNGRYGLRQIEQHFDRRLVTMRSLSVLAPTTMTVLNSTHLPKPNPWAGIAEDVKAKLLLSTLTPAQWQALTSVEGIGASDLSPKQRDIYLAMLPNPFRVSELTSQVFPDGTTRNIQGVPTALPAAQRELVRFSLNKAINWTFLTYTRGGISLGNGESASGSRFRVGADGSEFATPNEAFGVALCEEVPNRSKPSQLPWDWSALDVTVAPSQTRTVGDLIHLIAGTTRTELFCDPRYADRTIAFRGDSAKAGEILHALAWTVTGTWRRVGPAFVLTDDIAGLGVRHAAIGNWVQENALLGQLEVASLDKSLREGHFADYLGWSDSDASKPDAALASKIESFEKSTSGGEGYPQLTVAMTELSAEAQALAKRQIASYASNAAGFVNMPAASDVRADSVNLTLTLRAAWIIPGVGIADAPNIMRGNMADTVLDRTRQRRARRAPPEESIAAASVAFSPSLSVRALMIAPGTEPDIEEAARAAHLHGFTDLWVQVPRGRSELIAAAVRAAAANGGLAVRPVLSLLRAVPSDSPVWLDHNILGETMIGHINWWQSQFNLLGMPADLPGLTEPPPPFALMTNFATSWPDLAGESKLIQRGDYLACADPEMQARLVEDAGVIAAVPGIAGLVLRDTIAPGYSADSEAVRMNMFSKQALERDPLLPLGYTDAMRLAFLRKYEVDPIDLSPLVAVGQIQVDVPQGKRTNIQLPFFGGAGTMAEMNVRGSSEPHSVTDVAKAWRAYRKNAQTSFVSHVTEAMRTKFPDLSIVVRNESDPIVPQTNYFGTLDHPIAGSTVAPTGAEGRTGQQGTVGVLAAARAASKSVYYSITPPSQDATSKNVSDSARLSRELQKAASWDGVVIDLTAASTKEAMEIIANLPIVPSLSSTTRKSPPSP